MQSRTEKVLWIYLKMVICKQRYSRDELSEILCVSTRNISRYIEEINMFLFDNFIYKELKYSYFHKTYSLQSIFEPLKIGQTSGMKSPTDNVR